MHSQEWTCYLQSKNAGKMPAVRKLGTKISRNYYTPEVTIRQGKNERENGFAV
jgi:hypothetical protein